MISIILPTFNRLPSLQRVLAGLEKQTHGLSDLEIIIVSDGSTDGTDDFLRTLDSRLPIIPVFQSNQGVAAARNAGIARTTGDLVLFIDDDVVPSPQLIDEHLKTHARCGENVIVLGPMLTPSDFEMAPWVQWEQAMLQKQYNDMLAGKWEPTARQFYTGNTSLARKHLIAAGGFDPKFRRAEDVELAYRLAERGLKFVFNADAIGWHYASRSYKSWLEIPYVYGRNDVIFTREKKQTWLLPTIMREFHLRNPLIRALTYACLDHKTLSGVTIATLKHISELGHRGKISALPRIGYSGIFNLRHYQGVADELGGRAKFFALADRAKREPNV